MPTDLLIKQPVHLLNRELALDFKKFLVSVVKGEVALNEMQIDLKLAKSAGEIAWLLIHAALQQTIWELVNPYRNSLIKPLHDLEIDKACRIFDHRLNDFELTINSDFFIRPQDFSFLRKLTASFAEWLQNLGISPPQAHAVANRLPSYLALALHDQHQHYPQQFADLEIFAQFDRQDAIWLHYQAWLIKQLDEPLGGEPFSLRQVYVPLRAYFKERLEQEEKSRVVVELGTAVRKWLTHSQEAICVISGGSGAGKTAFVKTLAAQLAKDGQIVLLILLHLFNFKENLLKSIEAFINFHPILKRLPANSINRSRWLIIFDGLDEFVMRNQSAFESTQSFLAEIHRTVAEINQTDFHLQILITSRPTHINRQFHQIFYMLGYFLNPSERKNYVDTQGLLSIDQRDLWWRQYALAKGRPYLTLPSDLKNHSLEKITAQPLLNYLLALSYERKFLDFSTEISLNQIYADLLQAVFEHQQLLEAIAAATWPRGGRLASLAEAEKNCEGSLSKIFQETPLTLITFQPADSEKEAIFEFTHKSFVEYLTARYIVNLLEKIQHGLTQGEGDETAALKIWLHGCKFSQINDYLLPFVGGEIALRSKSQVAEWQTMLSKLIAHGLANGLPLQNSTFRETYQQTCYAEETLLIVLNMCARITEQISDVHWPSPLAFGEWMNRLRGQRGSPNAPVLFHDCLSYLNLSGIILITQDFFKANFTYTNLAEAQLNWANLRGADFKGANLSKVNFECSDLSQANLARANLANVSFQEANLVRANLKEANLMRANFLRAQLSGANLVKANLGEANLARANLQAANLSRTHSVRTVFTQAVLIDAELAWANLEQANLTEANLLRANLAGAELNQAQLGKANLSLATLALVNLAEANLTQANLKKANLAGANLRRANLEGACLEGAELAGANFTEANLKGTILES